MNNTSDISYKKAAYIADGLGEDVDDVYDILLGHIKRPAELVSDVERASDEYDRQKERGLREAVVHQKRTA